MPDTNPPIVVAKRYYPRLSEIVTVDDLPEFLSFVQEGLNAIFDKIHYKNLQYSKSSRGDSAFYSLDIVSREAIGLTIPGGLKLVLNPDAGDANISSFPIMLEYQWEILGFLRSFSLNNFSFTPKDFYSLGLQVFRISDDQVLANTLNFFTTPATGSVNKFDQLAVDINTAFPGANFTLPQDPTVDKIVAAIDASDSLSSSAEVIFTTYILNADLGALEDNLQRFFNIMVPDGIKAYIQKLIKPKARAAFKLSAGLQFPRDYLKPVYGPNGENPYGTPNPSHALEVIPADNTGNPLVTLRFGEANFYADTEQGLGYAMEFVVETSSYAQIGNTGLIIFLDNLKIDLSKDSNIPEADADGRPADFVGVYAEQLDIILPKKWFKEENGQTLKISSKKLLVGTGGFSGNIALETINNTPVLTDDYFWFTFGKSNGFKVGFNRFDITFKQSKIISSNIAGGLEIKNFKYPEGHPRQNETVQIGITGHMGDNGDFNLTASVQDYPIRLPDVFTYNIKTAEIGREGDGDFYIGTSGRLEFDGILKEVLHLKAIDIDRLRIYSDGSIEFEGGSIMLASPIVLPLGPADITVTAIHYGSHQKEINGVMRKFNYFGFDGGLSVNPLGVEIRGDGVKYYYCVDDLPGPKPGAYLHIQTLYLDLTIPASTPTAIINGWLSIPEPGQSKEYAGGIKLKLPQAKISGGADMKLAPSYPAFIIDAEIEFPAPIPLGTFAIYGFRGLLGYRYVAEKEAVGLVSGVDTWYDYYKVPPRGIHVSKFNGPDKTKGSSNPFSIGAGASLGTSFDNGTVINIKAMILLSIPSLFMIDGRAAILAARLGLEDTKDPPFFAMLAVGDDSLEFGFGADFKMPTSSGFILQLYADVQAAFFFKDSSRWYVNIGTRENPVTAKILDLVTIKSYLMLSAKGIEAGARGELDFERQYAGIIYVRAWAYIEVGGKISFERPQFGSFMDAGVGATINVKIVELTASFQVLFTAEAVEPFRIYGQVRIKIKIKIAWVFSFKFNQNVEIMWEKPTRINTSPVNPLLVSEIPGIIEHLVKGVNMLSNETFELTYLGEDEPTHLDAEILTRIIPLDTYIDIKTQKPLNPGAVANIIGGVANAATGHIDLIPPDDNVKGKPIRQVRHEYSVDSLKIKAWRHEIIEQGQVTTPGAWVDYNPYKALYPEDNSGVLDTIRVGQFQKTDGVYNTIRILGTTPFSYTEQGEPGWYIPEQYGLTPAVLFCESPRREIKYANFLNKPLGQQYFCLDDNQMFYSNGVSFFINNQEYGDFGEVNNDTNSFNFAQSLSFYNQNPLEIVLPAQSVYVGLKLSSGARGLILKYYARLEDNYALQVPLGNPDPLADNQNAPYTRIIDTSQLSQEIIYSHPGWRPITKVIIEPLNPNAQLIADISEQISAIESYNEQIALGLITGQPLSTEELEAELQQTESTEGGVFTKKFLYDTSVNLYTEDSVSPDWQESWDSSTDHKFEENAFGFHKEISYVRIESDFEIIKITALPLLIAEFYHVIYNGKSAEIYFTDINDYTQGSNLQFEIIYYDSGCSKEADWCNLYDSLNDVYSNCFLNPVLVDNSHFESLKLCANTAVGQIYSFDIQFPEYKLIGNMQDRYNQIEYFIANPDTTSYGKAFDALSSILNFIAQQGSCYCTACYKDYLLCDLSDALQNIVDDCLVVPPVTNPGMLSTLSGCIRNFYNKIYDFEMEYTSYDLAKTYLSTQLVTMGGFTSSPSPSGYVAAYEAALGSIAIIRDLGNCDCGGNEYQLTNETLFHEIGWLTYEDYSYNSNIPSQEAIAEDAQATFEGITSFLQPIWRPQTSYYIHFVLKDKVNNKESYYFPFTYGFSTAGPLGYFHNSPEATYGERTLRAGETVTMWEAGQELQIPITSSSLLNDIKGKLSYADGTSYPDEINNKLKPHPESYPLTSLRQYIDYQRSYPNADGNLLSAKPLFYNDEATRIYLFYTKPYAVSFFSSWQPYQGMGSVNGRIKIVIKDPSEGIDVLNPPYLVYDEDDTLTSHIPQTIESWENDQNPIIPFVISQWGNLYQANNCIITGGDPIKPASKFTSVALKNLKPNKLYTAIVNNLYDTDGDNEFSQLNETVEVHKFVFKTSRYANFAEQINSYLLTETIDGELVTSKAVFNLDLTLSIQRVDEIYQTINGDANPGDALVGNYQHAYDRVYEGLLGLPPLDLPVTTEFNILRRNNSIGATEIFGIIIKNPEPFNNPKMPLDRIMDTIEIMNGNQANPSYKILFSKDYSQAIIMHDSKVITNQELVIKFSYKLWDGDNYTMVGNPVAINIDLSIL